MKTWEKAHKLIDTLESQGCAVLISKTLVVGMWGKNLNQEISVDIKNFNSKLEAVFHIIYKLPLKR